MQMDYCKVLLKTQDGLLQTIEHQLRSTGPKLVPFLATRLFYLGGTSELRSVICTLVPLFSQVSSIYTNTILGSVQLYICECHSSAPDGSTWGVHLSVHVQVTLHLTVNVNLT